MKRITARTITIAAFVLLFIPALGIVAYAQAPASQAKMMSIWQARRAITTKPNDKVVAYGGYRSIRFSADGFEYDVLTPKKPPVTVKVDLTAAPMVMTHCKKYGCWIDDQSGRPFPKNTGLKSYLDSQRWLDVGSGQSSCLFCDSTPYTCSAECVHAAESFAAAFNVLQAFAKDTNAPLRTFPPRAVTWRTLATKPPIPEEVRIQRLMAEDAVKANKPGEALNYYENGIELYPTWPEGNFNAALIAGELGYYADAIEHMQAYLELVPDAADAQAARDKILIWQVKSKQ